MNEYVEGKVGPPGIALAVLGVAVSLMGLTVTGINTFTSLLPLLQTDDIVAALIASAVSLAISLIMPMMTIVGGIVILVGGLRLRAGKSAGLVYLGAIAAMIPCCSYYCCCFGIPLGIWAIVTMQDDQVQAAFAEG